MKQIIITIIAWTAIVLSASATGQEGERIVWKDKEYELLSEPLAYNPAFESMLKRLGEVEASTSLWRGYVGHWEIENDMLYFDFLVAEAQPPMKRINYAEDIPELRKYCKNGKCAATWFSGTLRVVSGDCIKYEHMGWSRYYGHEDFIDVKQGKVVSVKRMENKVIIKGKTEDPDAKKKFNQFLVDLGAQLYKRHPEASGRILAKARYSNFGLMMMPTEVDVEVTFPNKREETPHPQMEREIKEKLANYILANQYLPLYYINGEIMQESWTIPIRIPQ